MEITTRCSFFSFISFCVLILGSPAIAQDMDNDGVLNSADADDDNDGILDTVENSCAQVQIEWNHDSNKKNIENAVFSSNAATYFRRTEPVFFGLGLDESTDKMEDAYVLRGVNEATFADAKTFGDYVELSFTPSENMLLSGIRMIFETFENETRYTNSNFKMAIEFSERLGFEEPQLLFPCIAIDVKEGAGTLEHFNVLDDKLLLGGVPYSFRCYFFDQQGKTASNRVGLKGIQFPVTVVSQCDFDGDGLVNSHDLDSDGDGIYDVVESGGVDLNNDGYADDDNDNRNNFQSNGIPSSANKGNLPLVTAGIFDFLNPDTAKKNSSETNEAIATVK